MDLFDFSLICFALGTMAAFVIGYWQVCTMHNEDAIRRRAEQEYKRRMAEMNERTFMEIEKELQAKLDKAQSA